MEYINIQTSQNVEIESQVAGLGDRILAGIVDMIFLACYYITLLIIYFNLMPGDWFFYVMSIPFLLYHLLCELFLGGQSFGKKIIRIKVVSLSGVHVSFGSYLLRWMFRLIENPFMMMDIVAIITMTINGKGQRLGDIVAGTTVISLKKKTGLDKTIYVDLPENYQVIIPEVSNLSTSDISTANEILNTYLSGRESDEIWNLVIRTKSALEKKMKINSYLTPVEFLRTVLKDYNFLNRSGN